MAALARPVPTTGNSINTYQFSKDLELGDENLEVKELQKYLNQAGFIVAKTGAGSFGQETTYFGLATQAALIKFQKAKNINPTAGYFGPKTRGLVNTTPVKAEISEVVKNFDQNSNSIVTAGWLVKDKNSPRVYYVATNLELQWIVSEEAAVNKFGSSWYLDIRTFDDLEALGLSFGDHIF
jgi:peptidoglycan hydrolase-like protein with peptidoglycan-binding domain